MGRATAPPYENKGGFMDTERKLVKVVGTEEQGGYYITYEDDMKPGDVLFDEVKKPIKGKK